MAWDDLGADRPATMLREYYEARIFPVLTPLAVDPGHPFPYISNLALSLAAHVADPDTGERRFVRLKVPDVFPRLLPLGDGRFVPAEEVIARPAPHAVRRHDRRGVGRLPRHPQRRPHLEEEEADDLLEAVELELRQRRFNKAIRLEVADDIGDEMLELLVRELDLDIRNVSRHRALIDLSCLWQLHALDRPEAEGSGVAAGHRRPTVRRRGDRPIDLLGDPRPCRARPPPVRELRRAASRRSSSRPPTTRGCSRSR